MLASLAWLSLLTQTDWPVTTAESSNYQATSTYADVVRFCESLKAKCPELRLDFIGETEKQVRIPLVTLSFPPVASRAEARKLGRPVVYIQANIHAGEVEGKEAILEVLRKLVQDGPKGLAGRMVVVVTPIYNIDGNEQFGPVEKNRPEQDGPLMVGVRANGQGLDLNRDAMKAVSHEMRAVLKSVYVPWEPDVMMDLHTTDGTRHGYDLTYLAPTHPGGEPSVYGYGLNVLSPTLERKMAKLGTPIFPYGNLETIKGKPAWLTTGPEGRYCTNYVGLRNRLALLSEAATYIPFKDRIEVTKKFVWSTLSFVDENRKRLIQLFDQADARVAAWGNHPDRAPALAIRTELEAVRNTKLPVEDLGPGEPRPLTGRPKKIKFLDVPSCDRFKATRTAKFPAGYVLPASATPVVELLRRHGIRVERVSALANLDTTFYRLTEWVTAARPFQNRRLVRLEGTWETASARVEQGEFVVRTNQPLGVLAFHLLEPESIDGVIAWGLFSETRPPGSFAPVRKLMSPPKIQSTPVE
ncbi:MAG: hypothetical protein JST35_00235 [Armatimonadetes bacterium]|nr:hypothetical protein [Armatimonadota bacterium]